MENIQAVLVTGGGGFIGSHLCEKFLEMNKSIIIYDNFRRDSLQFADQLKDNPNVEIINGDILDAEAVSQAVKKSDAVVHLAAIAGVSSYYSESVKTLKTNIMGTINILEAMEASDSKYLVDFSTSEVYGAYAGNASEDDAHSIGPVKEKRWVYAVSKLASEFLCIRTGEESSIECATVRPFNIYGPRQTGEGAIRNFSLNALKGEDLEVEGEGEDIRSWCYVSDIVDATIKIFESDSAWGKTFNIGNPEARCSTLELAKKIRSIVGQGNIKHSERAHAGIFERYPNIDNARKVLDFQPSVSLDEGLEKAVAWYRENSL